MKPAGRIAIDPLAFRPCPPFSTAMVIAERISEVKMQPRTLKGAIVGGTWSSNHVAFEFPQASTRNKRDSSNIGLD